MRPLLLLTLFVGPTALAAPPTPPAAVPAPRAPLPPAKPPTPAEEIVVGVEGTAPSGLIVHADTRDEYLAGFPILVEVAISNRTDAPKPTADLSLRPHLVHFKLVSPEGKTSERYTTPPAFDTGEDWTLAPKTTRSVLLEIPSSAGFDMGDWQLNVMVGDGAQAVILPVQKFRIVPAHPVAGDVVWEPTIEKNSGAVVPWVHQAKHGFDLYLNQYAPGDVSRLLAHSRLLRSPTALSPLLSLTQANSPRSRWIYWQGAPNELRTVRLEGTHVSGTVRSLGAAWPKVELLARGVSDSSGGLLVPVWIPAPKGDAGSVKVLVMEERGAVRFRSVADFPHRPAVATSGVDASGSLVLVLGHERGLDVYRVAPGDKAELPVRGARAWKSGEGWTTAAAAFDILPDKDDRAGGLSILAVQTQPAVDKAPAQLRSLRVDLAGKLTETGPAAAWSGPLTFEQLIPAGYEPFHYLTRDAAGAAWFGAAGAAPVNLGKLPPAQLWPAPVNTWRARWVAGDRILSEKAVPSAP